MSEQVKLSPSESAEPKLAKDETKRVTSDVTEASKAETSVTEKATNAATAAKDNVFSMFGGGSKPARTEVADDENEPSGSSKKKATDVCAWCFFRLIALSQSGTGDRIIGTRLI